MHFMYRYCSHFVMETKAVIWKVMSGKVLSGKIPLIFVKIAKNTDVLSSVDQPIHAH